MEASSAPLRWWKSITPASAVSGCLPVGLLLEGCLAALESVANHTSQKFFLRVQVAIMGRHRHLMTLSAAHTA